MGIPDGKLYDDGSLGAGQVATIEPAVVNAERTGAPVGFGQGVVIKDGLVVPATGGNIFGVAIRRSHVNADHLYPDSVENDKFEAGETIGVLRDGTIAVPISEDVNMNENAAVGSDGNFKIAKGNDVVVGVFISSGDKGGTANMQTRIQLSNSNVTGGGVANENMPEIQSNDSAPQANNAGSATNSANTDKGATK